MTHEENLAALEDVCKRATIAASMYRQYMSGVFLGSDGTEYPMSADQITQMKQKFVANRTAGKASWDSVQDPE